jgi:histidyl-tRNA synthetase
MLAGSGLPPAATAALVEILSEAAAGGQDVRALEAALDRLVGWSRPDASASSSQGDEAAGGEDLASDSEFGPIAADDQGVDRLFRHLVPDVTGRRSGREIINRLRRKWDLGHSLRGVLDRVRGRVHALADLRGPAPIILDRLSHEYAELAPNSLASLRDLVELLGSYGIDPDRIELDLGFGRGIGFYTKMIFEVVVPTPTGPVEVCGGGRYDGLARVLGSDRDDRGVGFAFGLERLLAVSQAVSASRLGRGHDEPAARRGFLIASTGPGSNPGLEDTRRAAIRLAAELREQLDVPVILTEFGHEEAIVQAGQLGLSHLLTVGETIEAWDLGTREVRTVTAADLVALGRGRLGVVRRD